MNTEIEPHPPAVERLDQGNRAYAARSPAGPASESFFAQAPFAAVLACSDARLPVEQVFGQEANHLFVVRLAGNVPSPEALESLEFGVGSLESIELMAVVGHTSCGALTAAAAAYLSPGSHPATMKATTAHLWTSVHLAARALEQAQRVDWSSLAQVGPPLIDLAALAHAARTAMHLQNTFSPLRDAMPVVYGLYNLHTRQVGQPLGAVWQPGLRFAPEGPDQVKTLLAEWASSAYIHTLLGENQAG
jgi:carbonic anhydrase